MSLPSSTRYLVVGAGIHGLSTAYHLAQELESPRHAAPAPTSSCSTSRSRAPARPGIACGVVRNNYFQPAMSELMQACVEVWESDPEAYAYNPVGYMALGPLGAGRATSPRRYERQERIGYRSDPGPGRGRGRRVHEGALPRLAGARA